MKKAEFLQFAINYQESRIARLDTKANILIAIQIGLLGVISFVVDKYLLTKPETTTLALVAIIICLICSLFVGAIILLSLNTLRPSRNPLSKEIKLDQPESVGIIWPKRGSVESIDLIRKK